MSEVSVPQEAGPNDVSPPGLIARRASYAALIIFLLALTNFRAILPIFRDHLQAYLAIDDGQFGLMLSIPQWIAVGPLLLVGWLLARWGARRMLTFSLACVAAGMVGVALCGARWPVLAGALAMAAIGAVLLDVSANSALVQLYPDARRRMLSLAMAARSGTETVVPMLAEGLLRLAAVAPAISFAAVLHAPFAMIAVAFIAGSLLVRAPGARPETTWHWREMLISRRSLWLVALTMLHGMADASLFTWMPRFLDSASFTGDRIPPGFVLSAFSVAYIVSRLILAQLPEGWGRRALLVLPGLLGGGVLIASILSRDYLLTAAGYVVGAFLWSCEYPVMLGRLAELEHERFGAVLALVSVAATAGFALALMLSGWFIQAMGEARMWIPMAVMAGGFPCVGLGGWLWLRGEKR